MCYQLLKRSFSATGVKWITSERKELQIGQHVVVRYRVYVGRGLSSGALFVQIALLKKVKRFSWTYGAIFFGSVFELSE